MRRDKDEQAQNFVLEKFAHYRTVFEHKMSLNLLEKSAMRRLNNAGYLEGIEEAKEKGNQAQFNLGFLENASKYKRISFLYSKLLHSDLIKEGDEQQKALLKELEGLLESNTPPTEEQISHFEKRIAK